MAVVRTEAIDVGALDVGAVDVVSVEADWSEGYAETWDFVEAPSCPECDSYARWDAEGFRGWVCPLEEGDGDGQCLNGGGEVELEDGGPMMSYYYPLPDLGDADGSHDAAERIRDLPLCLIVWEDGRDDPYALALTGGGMDLSWEICEAFMRLGFLPPARFADLPGMSGVGDRPSERVVVRACVRSLEVAAERAASRAVYMRANAARLAERYTVSRFTVSDLQACEPDALPAAAGVVVTRQDRLEQGFPVVTVSASSRAVLLEYVGEHWGTEDPGWFQSYVVDRVVEEVV